MDLRTRYTDYVAALNERRFDDLPRFVADELTYDEAPITRGDYRAMLERDVATFPDLFFDVVHLVVSEDLVAARIRFDCTPVEPFRGFAPTGARVGFGEHVFYRFAGGRIAAVWSLIDDAALQRQLPRA